MAAWNDVSLVAPAFAAAVQTLFDAHEHKTMATLRKDGSPRISGIEADFVDGELWLGAMWQSRKRLTCGATPASPSPSTADASKAWRGDAKIAGRAEEVVDPERKRAVQSASGGEAPSEPFHLFRADVTKVVLVRVGEPPDHLVVESWHEGRGLRRVERR